MKRIISLTILFIILFFSCKKEEPATIPALSTTPASAITTTTAISGGSIINDGGATVIANGVCWGINPNPSTSETKTSDGVGTVQFTSSISGLTAGTSYHVRAYATNSVGTAYGADLTFTTLGQAPSGLTQLPTNITFTGVTLNGTVNPNDLSTTVTFEYGTTTSYGSTAPASQSPVTGNTMVNVNAEISGLLPGTTYHYRVKTVNSIGTTYGEDKTFTTSGQAPTVITQPACCLSAAGATLNGSVNANNVSSAVSFEYGTNTNYGQTIAAIQSPVNGNTFTNVSAGITGLSAGTTYHFRVKAINSVGTSYGSDMTFTTPDKPSVSTVAVTDKTYNSATTGGTIVTDGGAAITAKGVCWNTTGNPTIADSKTNDGSGSGSFISSMTGLLPTTTYYVKAYATNNVGTSYGNEISFITNIAPPTNGLVAYYPFITNANEYIGNINNGTINGATLTTDRFGRANNAFHFIGQNSITTDYSGILGTADRTISFWAKMAQDETGGYTVHYGGGGSTMGTSIAIFINPSGTFGVDTRDANVSFQSAINNDDTWHHYIFIFSTQFGTSLDGVKMYRDGVLCNTITFSYHYTSYPVNTVLPYPVTFGDSWALDASLDDVRFYNRVLSDSEILQLFHEGGWQ